MPPTAPKVAALCAVLVSAAVLGACGESGPDRAHDRLARGTITIYTSLPRRGVSAAEGRAVLAGERLALRDAGARAAGRRVRLVAMDSTKVGDDQPWDPGAVNANADRASDDRHAAAYIGELDYGATAISLPRTNEAGILQISPGDTLTSLTRQPPEQPRAGPARYYPTDRRTFVRLVPTDLLIGTELARRAASTHARTASLVSDRRIYGRELADVVSVRARHSRLRIAGAHDFPRTPDDVQGTAQDIAKDRPGVVILTGVSDRTTRPLLAALRKLLPDVPVLGGAGLAARPLPGRMPESITALGPLRGERSYPPAGRRVMARLRAGPASLYGYAAMRMALRAIDAGGPVRSRIVRAARRPGPRDTVLGRVDLLRRGDLSEARLGVYRLRAGAFRLAGLARGSNRPLR